MIKTVPASCLLDMTATCDVMRLMAVCVVSTPGRPQHLEVLDEYTDDATSAPRRYQLPPEPRMCLRPTKHPCLP